MPRPGQAGWPARLCVAVVFAESSDLWTAFVSCGMARRSAKKVTPAQCLLPRLGVLCTR